MIDGNLNQLVGMIRDAFLTQMIEVEASGRHVHLDTETKEKLFGKDYQLTKVKDLSQPGQFVCKERVTVVGPKGILNNVVILGPERKETQVEVSLTDAVSLGVKAPVRESGDLLGTPPITLKVGNQEAHLSKGLIVAKRHIHMVPKDAERFGLKDREIVQVQVFGNRPLIFDDVVVRVSEHYCTFMHIDYDEANACGFKKGTLARIIKKVPKG